MLDLQTRIIRKVKHQVAICEINVDDIRIETSVKYFVKYITNFIDVNKFNDFFIEYKGKACVHHHFTLTIIRPVESGTMSLPVELII